MGVNPGEADEATRLALAASDGDPAAMASFVRSTQADVWRLCAALVDPGVADDLTQETYLRAWRSLPRFTGDSTARTWLLSIARRTCADHIRQIVRHRRFVVRHRAVSVASDVSNAVELDDLLGRLPVARRSAFVLTQVVGLSYAEAAVVENVPVGTIRSRVARARDDLVRAWNKATAI